MLIGRFESVLPASVPEVSPSAFAASHSDDNASLESGDSVSPTTVDPDLPVLGRQRADSRAAGLEPFVWRLQAEAGADANRLQALAQQGQHLAVGPTALAGVLVEDHVVEGAAQDLGLLADVLVAAVAGTAFNVNVSLTSGLSAEKAFSLVGSSTACEYQQDAENP